MSASTVELTQGNAGYFKISTTPLATITGKVTTVVKTKNGITHVIEQPNGKVINLPLDTEIPVETQVRITVEDVEPF